MVNFGNISIADLRLGVTQVKAAYLGNKQVWSNTPEWLRFVILADDTSIDIVNDSGTLEMPDLEYSVDDGQTWTQWVPGSNFPHEMAGAVVYVRAGATGNTGFADVSGAPAYWRFTSDNSFSASGNIMYLLSRDESTGLSDYCFYRLFDGCTMLIDASGLELPATTLAEGCYEGMFRGCTSLTAAPKLPATTLAMLCYNGMLSACTSLSSAPALPATTLADHCYHYMFRGCTSLTAAPKLPATTLAEGCYQSMFSGCSSLSSVEVPFTAWNPSTATINWLKGVAASGTFTCPAELPDTRDASHIPVGWTKAETAQRIPLTFTAQEANSTVRLDKVGSPGAVSLETSTDRVTWTDYSWSSNTGDTLTLANVGDKVYFRAKNENDHFAEGEPNCHRFIMTGTIAASGNLQTLLKADGSRTDIGTTGQGFRLLFKDCTSLTTAPELPATTLIRHGYQDLFKECTNLSIGPTELPAQTAVAECYRGLFSGCSSLISAPKIAAIDVNQLAFAWMFEHCTSLSSIEVVFTTWPGNQETLYWVSDVAASGTFTCPAELPDTRGASNIPSGWTKVDAA